MKLRARRPRRTAAPPIVRDPGILEGYLEDASGRPPGTASGLVRLADEEEASAVLAATLPDTPVLCQAARSSLTGGAIPEGELVLSVERLDGVGPIERSSGSARVTVQAGVRLDALQRQLAEQGFYYPPVPTYQQAMVGGTVATNAGGAASFKYGVTRQWVEGLTVLLFNGDRLRIERGQVAVDPGRSVPILLDDGTELRVPAPTYRLPALKKISAGYHAADPLDLVDLFVGSEGTLGLITSIRLGLVPLPPAVLTGLVFLEDFAAALALAGELRSAAESARLRADPRGPDVRAIESIDAGGLELLRSGGEARRLRIRLPAEARAALLFELELAAPLSDAECEQTLFDILEGGAPPSDDPLARLCGILARHGALEGLELALPGATDRRQALREFREAVPLRAGELLAARRRERPGLRKVGGDLIVPQTVLGQMVRFYEQSFRRRGLQSAVWGHLSDGNLHPNALPRDEDEQRSAVDALLEFADEAIRLGGSPLSEHGVGRDPLKQELLRRFLGEDAIDEMRRIKRAIDPPGRFAPGVLFPAD